MDLKIIHPLIFTPTESSDHINDFSTLNRYMKFSDWTILIFYKKKNNLHRE